MDFYDTEGDLLGNSRMPIRYQPRTLLGTLYDYSFYALIIIGLWVAYIKCRNHYRDWNETNIKKAIRRRYGIPDEDNGPFNVAYAKAEQKRRDLARIAAYEEAAARAPKRPSPKVVPRLLPDFIPQGPLRRVTASGLGPLNLDKPLPSYDPAYYANLPSWDSSKRPKPKQDTSDRKRSGSSGSSKQRKRSSDKDDRAAIKKARKELLESNRAVSIDITDEVNRNAARRSRGSKRHAGPEEEIANDGSTGKKAGKRARRQSKKIQETLTGDDENDQLMDLDQISRGKKRDRNEAGSTFGGEEDAHANNHGRKTRRQKRKSNTSADVDAAVKARGTKRSYEIESTLGSEEEDINNRNPKTPRKRGKRMETDSDVSMEDLDESCIGRKIGDEWHANGETFKVGPDGRRLHQALVKKRKSRFNMPQDSEHPDTIAQYEILIEMWLNDVEYDTAFRRGDIFIPDKIGKSEVKKEVQQGKQLLWINPNIRKSTEKTFNNSLILEVGRNSNPFDRPSRGGSGRRLGIAPDYIPPPPSAPSMRGVRSYSKWEKQEFEAEALAKIRQKRESEKKESTSILKKVAFDIPPSTGSPNPAPTPPIVSSTSAPASYPAPSSMPNVPTNGFAFPTNNGNAASAPFSSASSTPTFSVTPSQTAKEPATGPANSVFGNSPFNTHPTTTQPIATSTGNSTQSPFGGQTDDMSISSPPAPNPFGFPMKSQTSSAPATTPSVTMFDAKPAAPSTASTQASNGFNAAPSVFSLGNKPAAQAPVSAFGALSANGFTPSANTPASNNSAAFGFPSVNGFTPSTNTNTPVVNGFTPSTNMPATNGFAHSTNTNAPIVNGFTPSTNTNAPAFNGFTPSTNTPAANGFTPSTNMPASNNSSSPFSLGGPSNQQFNSFNKPAEQQASTTASTAPRFSFGNVAKPAASSPSPSPAPITAAAPKPAPSHSPFGMGSTSNSNTSAMTGISTPAASTSTSTPKFSFSGTTAASSSAAPATTNGFSNNNNNGTTTSSIGTKAAPAASGFSTFKFGPTQPIVSPFGNTSSPFGAAPNSSAPSPFGTTTSTFSKTPTPAPAPFGVSAKQNGEAPKSMDKQDKPQFSFNFGAPTSSSPAYGTTTTQNGTTVSDPFGFSIPVNGNTNGFGSSTFGQK